MQLFQKKLSKNQNFFEIAGFLWVSDNPHLRDHGQTRTDQDGETIRIQGVTSRTLALCARAIPRNADTGSSSR